MVNQAKIILALLKPVVICTWKLLRLLWSYCLANRICLCFVLFTRLWVALREKQANFVFVFLSQISKCQAHSRYKKIVCWITKKKWTPGSCIDTLKCFPDECCLNSSQFHFLGHGWIVGPGSTFTFLLQCGMAIQQGLDLSLNILQRVAMIVLFYSPPMFPLSLNLDVTMVNWERAKEMNKWDIILLPYVNEWLESWMIM